MLYVVAGYLDWLQSLIQFFINVPYHILETSLILMARYQSLKQFFINVPYHILETSLTLMALRSHKSKTSYKYMIWHIDEKLF